MTVKLIQHIQLCGYNPRQALIVGTNTKAYLVAQFALGWGIDAAIAQYGLNRATIHAAISFYYDNLLVLEETHAQTEVWLKGHKLDGKAQIDKQEQRQDEQ
jgi:uncharacterized protein (DUF433 family)